MSFIRFRWCSVAFYQIVLPDGTSIITDPAQYLYPDNMVAEADYIRYRDQSAADILDRVDYVLLSHTHFDHVQDLLQVMAKFPDARVIVPDSLTLPLLLEKNLNTIRRNVFMIGHQDELRFPEFSLKGYMGKHTVFASNDPFLGHIPERNYRTDFPAQDGSPDVIGAIFAASGGMDLRNYVLTTPDGLSVFIWAGQIQEDFRRFLYHGLKPDLMFVQIAGTNIGGDRKNPSGAIIGEFALDVEPKIVLPIHQEKFTADCLESIRTQCNRYFTAKESLIRFENPRVYQWYTLTKDPAGSVTLKTE